MTQVSRFLTSTPPHVESASSYTGIITYFGISQFGLFVPKWDNLKVAFARKEYSLTSLRDYPEKYKRFLERLRQARLEAGLTQTEVANVLQKPQSFVSKCETGERRVDVVELQVLANLYGVPLTYFLEGIAKEQHE